MVSATSANHLSPWEHLESSIRNPELSTLEKVKRLAGAMGLSLKDVAEAIGYHYVNFHKLLTGDRMNRQRAEQTAEFFGVELGVLFPSLVDSDRSKISESDKAEFLEGPCEPLRVV